MLHPVLQIAVAGADGRVEPRRHKDTQRGGAVRINVHEAENLRLGIPQRMDHCAGLEVAGGRQLDHGLHANGPVMLMVAFRQAEVAVELAADRADRPVAHDGQPRVDVHARHERRLGIALLVHALIGETHAQHAVALHDRRAHRRARPYLHQAGAHQLVADPRHE